MFLMKGRTPQLIIACRRKRALVMEYLNDTLSQQFEKCQLRLSPKTITMLCLDMLSLCKEFYEKTGHVHVDLKPANFCTGPDGKGLYLIDFGYATSPTIRLPGQVFIILILRLEPHFLCHGLFKLSVLLNLVYKMILNQSDTF